MVVFNSQTHLKRIERSNKSRKNNEFNGVGFMSVQHRENRGEFRKARLVKPVNLIGDGKNYKLKDYDESGLTEKAEKKHKENAVQYRTLPKFYD